MQLSFDSPPSGLLAQMAALQGTIRAILFYIGVSCCEGLRLWVPIVVDPIRREKAKGFGCTLVQAKVDEAVGVTG